MAAARINALLGGALAVLQTIALFWFATPTGLPLDDAWIHQVVARTFAESGTLGYAPGEHGAAATSYLWAALLAVNFRWLHVDPVRWAFALNLVAQLATGQLLFALLARGEPAEERSTARLGAFACALLACTSANVLWYAHSGMEAALFVALSVTAVWAATAPAASLRLALLAGVASGLAGLTRPEGAPLCALLVGHVVLRRRSIPDAWRRMAAIAGPALIAGVLYVGSNLAKTGHATPTTLSGRRWLWFEMTAGLSGFDRARDFVEAWITRLSSYTFDTGAAAAWVMVALAAYGAYRILRCQNDGARLLFAWAALHTVAYVFMLPTPGHGGRYQPFVPLLYVVSIAQGTRVVAQALARTVLRGGARVSAAFSFAALLPWVVLGLACTAKLRDAHALAVAHIDGTEIATGRFVDALPRGELVASFDIGGIGWATRRPILDAGGLSDPSTATLLQQGRIWQHLASRGVRWIVLPEGGEPVLPVIDRFVSRLHLDNPAVRLTRVHQEETPFERWQPAILATWNAAPKQVVYRLELTGAPGPPDVPLPPAAARRAIHDEAGLLPTNERLRAERSLAVLEAWGVPVNVHLLARADARPLAGRGEEGCTIHLGAWGIESAGCDAVADPAVLQSVLHEHVGRYLVVWDLGGAARAVPHAIALARRLRDPRFHPPLAPVAMPQEEQRPSTAGWGLGVVVGIFAALFAVQQGHAWRRRSQRAAGACGLAPAVLAVLALLSCRGEQADLVRAATQGRAATESALARGTGLEARGGGGQTALLAAAGAGDPDVIALLLAHGALPTATDDEGATALHHAARRGCTSCTMLLARAGTPLDAVAGVRKRTALHDATVTTAADVVRALLAAGARPDVRDGLGETALHLVMRADPARSTPILGLLLGAGADRRIADARGFTALHAAAAAGNLVAIRELAPGAGADLLAKETPSGETAVETATRYRQGLAADALLRSGALWRTTTDLPPLHDAARADDVTQAAALLAAGADPLRQVDGKTALAIARESASRRVEALLSSSKAP